MNFKNKLIRPYIIAEIGSNFNQNIEVGYEMILKAKKSGADAVKFQLFKASTLYPKDKKMFKIFKSIELTHKIFSKFYLFAKKINIDVSASVFDIKSAKFLSSFNIPFFKIASSEIANFELIDYLSKKNKPMILSTGMSELKDVKHAVKICEKNKNYDISILQCNSLYPLPLHKSNLNTLETFRKNFPYQIGFSDHTLDDIAAITSVGKGAIIFEKHITLDKKMDGPDHFYALEIEQFKQYVNKIRRAHKSLGSHKKEFLKEERANSRRIGLYYKRSIKKNERIKLIDIAKKRPPLGLTPVYLSEILNMKLVKNVKKNTPLFLKHFKSDK